jgi:SAM-dependent methyltransferase
MQMKVTLSATSLAMNFREKVLLITHSFAAVGVIETLKALGRYALRASDDPNFDKRYSTDTTTVIKNKDLEISDPEARKRATVYRTAPERFVHHLINHLDIDYREYDFVDIGCGKGRVLLIASNYPFRGISGVEISPPAYVAAKKNLQIYKCIQQKCFNIQIHNQDARSFEPSIANTVFYFFEPFDNLVLGAVLAKIALRLKGQGKSIYIICVWSNLGSMLTFIETLGFQTIRHRKMLVGALNYAVFALRSAA